MQQTIIIRDYDIRWPKIYQREQAKIVKVIGNDIRAIEHIGSTAVVGLAAKPVIDIMVAIESLVITPRLVEPLQTIGYEYVPEYEKSLPDRRFFHRGPSETTGQANRHFHLHMAEYTGKFWREHLLFRDYLRAHADVVREYQELKQELANSCMGDIQTYCEGKSDFIQNVIRLAYENQ